MLSSKCEASLGSVVRACLRKRWVSAKTLGGKKEWKSVPCHSQLAEAAAVGLVIDTVVPASSVMYV